MFSKLKFAARVVLIRLIHVRLRRRAAPWPPRVTPTTLVIAPHPDDETLGCGGLIKQRTAAGESVHVAFLTNGGASHTGHPDYTPERIAALRADEARVATGILGVSGARLTFFNTPDGQLPHLGEIAREALIEQIRTLILRTQPSEIFITSRHDGSSEHSAASELIRSALVGMEKPPRLLEYVVWSRWNPRLLARAMRAQGQVYRVSLSASEASAKRNALHVYRSQIEPLPPWHRSVLPAGFARLFQDPEEYFFDLAPHA